MKAHLTNKTNWETGASLVTLAMKPTGRRPGTRGRQEQQVLASGVPYKFYSIKQGTPKKIKKNGEQAKWDKAGPTSLLQE